MHVEIRRNAFRDALYTITRDDEKIILLTVCHTMSVKDKNMFYKFLDDLKVLDGY